MVFPKNSLQLVNNLLLYLLLSLLVCLTLLLRL